MASDLEGIRGWRSILRRDERLENQNKTILRGRRARRFQMLPHFHHFLPIFFIFLMIFQINSYEY